MLKSLKIFFPLALLAFYLHSYGCYSTKSFDSMIPEFKADSLTISISPEEFEKLKTSTFKH